MNNILDIIYVPLAYLLKLCYMLVNNYGIAILLFALIIKVLMLPSAIKGEKSRLRMAAIQQKVQNLQQKFKGNTKDPKYNEELSKLYQEEGYNPMSGCLPTLIQFPIILGLWNAIRQPLTYISGLGQLTRYKIVEILYNSGATLDNTVSSYFANSELDPSELATRVINWLKTNEMRVAQVLADGDNLNIVKNGLHALKDQGVGVNPDFELINLNFFGLNLGYSPSDFGILAWTTLIPIIAGVASFLMSYISTKVNAPAGGQQQGNMNMLLYTMPLISVIMGYSFQIGVGVYWIFNSVLGIAQIFLLRAIVKPPKDDVKPQKEKKLNYNQIEKMKRENISDDEEANAIVVEDTDKKEEE